MIEMATPKGFKQTEEHKRKIGLANKGRIPWNKGKQFIQKQGDKNHNWKGNDVGKRSLHEWIQNHKPKPEFCEICGKENKLELANISGEYKRDINDFLYVCRKCHSRYDYETFGNRKTWYEKEVSND